MWLTERNGLNWQTDCVSFGAIFLLTQNSFIYMLGAIQVLRNADGVGVSDFLEKNVTKV